MYSKSQVALQLLSCHFPSLSHSFLFDYRENDRLRSKGLRCIFKANSTREGVLTSTDVIQRQAGLTIIKFPSTKMNSNMLSKVKQEQDIVKEYRTEEDNI